MESSSSTGENSGAGGSDDAPNAESGGLQRVFYCHQCLRRTFPNAEHIQVIQLIEAIIQGLTKIHYYRTSHV